MVNSRWGNYSGSTWFGLNGLCRCYGDSNNENILSRQKQHSQTMRAGSLVTNTACPLAWSPHNSCQWFDCLNPLHSLCLGAGLDVIMNVIFGDDFEEVALHIALHSCWDSVVLQSWDKTATKRESTYWFVFFQYDPQVVRFQPRKITTQEETLQDHGARLWGYSKRPIPRRLLPVS